MEYPVRILVVEDSASLLRIYRHVLTCAGYVVLEAMTGAAALKTVHAESPDIVLLDRVLPDIDGSEICARLKSDPATAETYVIMVSGLRVTEDDRVSGLEAGADDYVVKPVGKRELLARINVATRLRNAHLLLRASESQFRRLAENSPDYIARIDREGKVGYLNPAARGLLASGPGLNGATPALVQHLTGNGRLSEKVKAVFATGRGGRIKSVLRQQDEVFHLDTRLVPEAGPDGEVDSILAVTRDYTDFVTAEQEIRRLAAVIQQSVDAVQISDAQGRIIYANAAFSQLTGLPLETVIGRELPGHTYSCSEHGSCRLLDHLAADLAGEGDKWQGLLTLQLPNDDQRDLDTTIFAIRDRAGSITNYAALQRDVTERNRSNQEREVIIQVAAALRTSLLRREVLDVTVDQIMSLAPVVSVVYCTLDQARGESMLECLRGTDIQLLGTRFQLADSLSEEIFTTRTPLVRTRAELARHGEEFISSKETRWVAGVPMLVRDQVDGILWISTNSPITERLLHLFNSLGDMLANSLERSRLYEETRAYAQELEQRVLARTQELAQANEQLRELDRLKSKFVSNVSHELRTPIANLKLYLNLLERGNSEKRHQYELMLQQSADRLSQLVQDILSLSRLEMAQLQPHEFAPTDLNAVVSQVVQHYQPQADSAGLTLQFLPAAELPLISGDYNQLSQLITNLLSNALTYTTEGYVQVKTCYEPMPREAGFPCVHLIVKDTGVGIHPEDMPHIYDRFYRGHYLEDRDIPGTGLGLAIVQEIVHIHQGQIDLASIVGAGTTIDVKLPAAL